MTTDSDKPIQFTDADGEPRELLCWDGESRPALATVGDVRRAGFVPVAEVESLRSDAEYISRWFADSKTRDCARRFPAVLQTAERILGAQPPSASGLYVGGYTKLAHQVDSARWLLEEKRVPGDGYDGSEVEFRIGQNWYPASGLEPCEPPSASGQAEPMCKRCNDTHAVETERGRQNCTHCPTPCEKCRKGGIGAYCETPRCACSCHQKASGQAEQATPVTFPRCDNCGESIYESDLKRPELAGYCADCAAYNHYAYRKSAEAECEQLRARAQSAESALAELEKKVLRAAVKTVEPAPDDARAWTVDDALKALALEADCEWEQRTAAESALAAAREELERVMVSREGERIQKEALRVTLEQLTEVAKKRQAESTSTITKLEAEKETLAETARCSADVITKLEAEVGRLKAELEVTAAKLQGALLTIQEFERSCEVVAKRHDAEVAALKGELDRYRKFACDAWDALSMPWTAETKVTHIHLKLKALRAAPPEAKAEAKEEPRPTGQKAETDERSTSGRAAKEPDRSQPSHDGLAGSEATAARDDRRAESGAEEPRAGAGYHEVGGSEALGRRSNDGRVTERVRSPW